MKTNRVCHYRAGGSDKVYVVSVVLDTPGKYKVVAKWGRVRKTPTGQVKGSGMSEFEADREAAGLFESKLKKGYKDIESSSYNDTLAMDTPWLQSWLAKDETGQPVQAVLNDPPATAPKPLTPGRGATDFEVVCVDNFGLEDGFDEDETYIAEPHKDPEMVWVYNQYGDKCECFASRFKKATKAAV